MIGKDYIDNFQYSSKVKSYVWKDERYTNVTSLIEDATAKIEEMSRPYKAYTAEVIDLAKASEGYKDILSYGIGDTVTLVSKKTRTREKQRIVKITEYPESPEKNTVEISNARKTQVGSGDRSEKIRTYNYPQGRITDHRIGLSIYQMENFLNGDLDEMIDNLTAADRAEKLQGANEE